MALTATFGADFSRFSSAVDGAIVKLRSFEDNSKKVEGALARMTDAYSGRRLLQDATLTAEAIERIGGTSKLTADELAKAGRAAEQAIAKMKALGVEVPANVQKIADAAKPIPERLTLAARAADLAKSSFGQMFGAFSAVNLVQSAVSSLVNFGKAAVDAAGKTVDLSAKLGVSTDAIQRWQFVAEQTGGTVDEYASAAFKLQTRLAGGSDTVAGALDALGVSMAELQGLNFEQQFDKVTRSLSAVQDATQRNALGVDLYGKSFERIAAGVAQNYGEMADAASISSAQQLHALDRAADRADQFFADMKKRVQAFLGDMVVFGEQLERQGFWASLKSFARAPFDPSALVEVFTAGQQAAAGIESLFDPRLTPQTVPAALTNYLDVLQQVRAEVARLTPEQRKQIDAALELGEQTDDLANRYGISEAAIRLYTAQVRENTRDTKANAAEAEKAAEATKRWHESYRSLSGSFSTWSTQLDRHGAQMRTTLGFYQAMPAAISSLDEGLRSDFIPAVQLSGDALMGLATVGQTSMLRLATTITTQGASNVIPAVETLGQKMAASLKAATGGLGSTLMAAFTGGGNVLQSVGGLYGGALGSSLAGGVGKALTSTLGKTLGGALGSVIPGLGTLLGSLGGQLFGKLFGKSEHSKVNDLRDAAFGAAGGFDALNTKAHAAGFTLERVLRAKTVKDYEAAIGELEAKLGSFAAEQAADQQRLNDAIQRYGFSLAELGPQLQSSRLNEQAKELIEDWRVLAAAGIDVATINAKMAESMNSYLQQALSFGAEVPNAMRPILEAMAKQGTLVDANGEAITDLESSGIKFSETMTEGFDRVVKKLDELIVKLQGAGSAIASIPKSVDVGVNYIQGSVPALDVQELPGYQTGTHGRYLDFKQGTAVQLHGRERVMTEAEGRADAAALARLADSIAGLDRRISQAVGRAVADAMILAPAR